MHERYNQQCSDALTKGKTHPTIADSITFAPHIRSAASTMDSKAHCNVQNELRGTGTAFSIELIRCEVALSLQVARTKSCKIVSTTTLGAFNVFLER